MRAQVLALVGAVAGALAQDSNATVVTDNPADARYIALLEGAVSGRALAGSDAFGLGVNFHVSLDGLPEDQGPFSYSLNQAPVPEDGNCTGTEGPFDPFGRTDDPPCDDDEPQSCVVGDLSGKHGTVEPPRAEVSYFGTKAKRCSFHDAYISLAPNSTAFFGNGSFVVYNATGESVACASFTQLAEGDEPGPAFPEPPEEEPVEEPPDDEEDDGFDFGDGDGDDDEDGDFDFGGDVDDDDEVDGDFDFGGDVGDDDDSDEDFDFGGDGDFDFGGDSGDDDGEDFDWGGDSGDDDDSDEDFDFGGDGDFDFGGDSGEDDDDFDWGGDSGDDDDSDADFDFGGDVGFDFGGDSGDGDDLDEEFDFGGDVDFDFGGD